MARKVKYIPKSKGIKLNSKNYKELLRMEKGEEYEFLEDYKKSTEPILAKHNICNHIWKVAPYEIIKRGSCCPICSNKNKGKSNLKELKTYLRNKFGYNPYTFLSDYVDTNTPIKYRCNICGYEGEMTPGNMKYSSGQSNYHSCPNCYSARNKNNTKRNKDEYIQQLKDLFDGKLYYEVLEDYKGVDKKIKHKCLVCNHEFEATPHNITYAKQKYNRRYCPSCNGLIRDNRPYEERVKEINSNIIPIEECVSVNKAIRHKCLKCNHTWKAIPYNVLNGTGCPKCSNSITESKTEKEIFKYIKDELNVENVISKDRTILDGKEVDILIPDKKICIEIDGLYWHYEKYKGKNYHKEKTDLANKKGYKLIHIFEDEYISKPELIKLKIKHILGMNTNDKIYARNCVVKEITTKDKNDFLNKNHIQGKDSSSIKLGLFYNDILVGVMTFGRKRLVLGNKDTNNNDYELIRFATEISKYRVIGGFGKLFKYFINNYNFNKIITYADLRWSQGEVYFKNGFVLSHISRPNYWYTDGKKRWHRFNFRKQKLKEMFPDIYDDKLTEFKIMDKTKKYKRIWDCGNMVFVYTKRFE